MIRQEVYHKIVEHLNHARAKHPTWIDSPCFIISIAAEEFGEWVKEMNDGSEERRREECLDLIAVLIRFLEGE